MPGETIWDWPHCFLCGSDLVIATGFLCFTLQLCVADLASVEALHSNHSGCKPDSHKRQGVPELRPGKAVASDLQAAARLLLALKGCMACLPCQRVVAAGHAGTSRACHECQQHMCQLHICLRQVACSLRLHSKTGDCQLAASFAKSLRNCQQPSFTQTLL